MHQEMGMLVVVSGPSGVGKGTICSALLANDDRLVFSVSATTRAPRPGEIDGVHYFFKTAEEFQTMVEQGAFLEFMKVFGKDCYGTPRSYVEEQCARGRDVLLDIDVQGAMRVKRLYPEAVTIFIAPPDLATLKARLLHRGTEAIETVEQRLAVASVELRCADKYDYVVVNDELKKTVEDMRHILYAERLRVCHRSLFINSLKEEIALL